MGTFYFDTTSASAITKLRYSKKKVDTLLMKSPAWGMMPKAPEYGGQSYQGALNLSPMASVSPSDATAFTTGYPSQYVQWTCSYYDLYASANVTGRAIKATKGDENAMVDVIVAEADKSYEAFGVVIGTMIWGNGGGSIGKFNGSGTVASTNAFTLSNINQITNFYKGQVLNAATTNGLTGSVETGSVIIASVDVNAGTLTPTANWSTGIPTISNSDYLFNQGCFGLLAPGIPGWIPDVNNRPQASDSFNGQNRYTGDPTRMAGVFYAGSGAPKEQSLFQLLTLIERLCGTGTGQGPTHCYLNPIDFADVTRSLTTRTQNVEEFAYNDPQVGFKGIEIMSDRGAGIKIFKDQFVPSGDGYLIDMNSWLIPSMGDTPMLLDEDGLEWARQPGVDAYQRRLGAHYTTYCSRPFANGVATF
jgi:hypothetical protein